MKKNMNKKTRYLETKYGEKRIRLEILFTPLILIVPFTIGILLIYDWYNRDLTLNHLELEGELMLGIIILVVNIIFDIPFVKSLRETLK